jgi:hypothetical protein
MASIMMSSGLAAVAPQVRSLSVRRLAAKQTDAVPVFPENVGWSTNKMLSLWPRGQPHQLKTARVEPWSGFLRNAGARV